MPRRQAPGDRERRDIKAAVVQEHCAGDRIHHIEAIGSRPRDAVPVQRGGGTGEVRRQIARRGQRGERETHQRAPGDAAEAARGGFRADPPEVAVSRHQDGAGHEGGVRQGGVVEDDLPGDRILHVEVVVDDIRHDAPAKRRGVVAGGRGDDATGALRDRRGRHRCGQPGDQEGRRDAPGNGTGVGTRAFRADIPRVAVAREQGFAGRERASADVGVVDGCDPRERIFQIEGVLHGVLDAAPGERGRVVAGARQDGPRRRNGRRRGQRRDVEI